MSKCQLPADHKHIEKFNEIMMYLEIYFQDQNAEYYEQDAWELKYFNLIFAEKRPQFVTLIQCVFNSVRLSEDAYDYLENISSPFYLYDHLSEHIDEIYNITTTGKCRHEQICSILAIEEQLENKVTSTIRQIVVNRDLNRYLMEFV